MFEVMTYDATGKETTRLPWDSEGRAIAHAKSILYTAGTVRVLITKYGQKWLGYVVGKDGKPEQLIF